MAQMPERTKPQKERSVNFYGEEVLRQIEGNIKLATLRKDDPKYHGFGVAETIEANCDGHKLDLIIWGVQESIPLREIDPVLLALDGFLTIDQAVTDLKVYPGYGNINEGSPMTLITTIDKDNLFNDFRTMRYMDNLFGALSGKSLSEVVRDPSLEGLFKPAIANWFLYRGGDVGDWLNFFANNGLLDPKVCNDVLKYSKRGKGTYFSRKILGNAKTAEFLLTHPFYDGTGSQPADWDYRNLYLPFVLGDLSQITKDRFHHKSYFK